MSEININAIKTRLEDLEKEIKTIKTERDALVDPTIKGLGKKYSELGIGDASAVIHLHNAVIERLELLTAKVASLEERTK